MSRSTHGPPQTSVTIRRRPGDFGGRGEVLLVAGTCCFGGGGTCCCCCCCLHWVGAAIGGTAGIAAASPRGDEKPASPVRRFIRGRVLWATWIVLLATVGALTAISIAWDPGVLGIAGPAAVIFTAAVGGTAGAVVAYQARNQAPARPVHPVARRYVLASTWMAVVATAGLIVAGAIWVSVTPSQGGAIRAATEAILWGLTFLPSLALLPVGLAALIGAALARRIERPRRSDPADREGISAGLGLAWRIAWTSFVWATFLSGAGYLAMYVIALFMD